MKKGRHVSYNRYKRKNLFLRAKPWLIAAGCLVCAGALGCAVYYLFTEVFFQETEEAYYEAAEESSLPVLSFEYEGQLINELSAFSDEMDLSYAAENVYLLEDTYDIPIEITLNGNTITSVGYRLYDMENSVLNQNGSSGVLETDGETLTTTITLDEVMSNDTEYVLDITAELSDGSELHYYTNILRTSGLYVSEQIELALSFMEATLSGDEEILYKYMDVNPWTQKNTDLSDVNLNSSYKQMMWQEMDVELYGQVHITILDIYGYIGCYRLDYTVSRTDDDVTEYYRVSEYYRIRLNSAYTSILTYERSVDQIFIPSDEVLSSSKATLGILSSDDIETASSDNGNYSCFVTGGSLWCMDSSAKTLTEIFSFEPDEISDITPAYYDHDIDIISVDDSGNIVFMNYGYMNAGLHEGLTGTGIYSYSAEDGEVTELLFIQSDLTYYILKEYVGEIAYINENNVLFILLGEDLYSISLDDYQMQIIAGGLTDGTYKVSTDEGMIAWQEDGAVNDADTIVLFDAETEESISIKASSGSCIKILGFIGEDLVYGQGLDGDYYTDESGDEYLRMSTVYVKDINAKVQDKVEAEDAYYISAEYEYNRIIIALEDGSTYSLYSSQIAASQAPEITSDYDDVRETIYYVSFIDKTTTAGDFTIDLQTKAYLSDYCLVEISDFIDLSQMYLAYGKGFLQTVTSSAIEAIEAAYDAEGYVKTGGAYFYRRGLVPGTVTFSDDAIAKAIEKYNEGSVINVSGMIVAEIQYFMGEGEAVFWIYGEDTYLIYGYDTSTNLRLYNIETGETSSMSSTKISAAFEEYPVMYILE